MAALTLLATAAGAQTPPDEDDYDAVSSIVVTGSIRQGGAQDIQHFREAAEEGEMPRPESLTVEGLMGEHNLTLPSRSGCDQLMCLTTESVRAALPTRPEDKVFVGLGFSSNVEPAQLRQPLNLVAVVDKSGSMQGEPLERVKLSLAQIVRQMRPEDQISVVLYGDQSHIFLPPTRIASGRDAALRAIAEIKSAGSTNMEAGLKVGYQLAFDTAPAFTGRTRLMLFTDEQPNVGRTDAGSFVGMAEAASRQKIGLTTIGVGVQFDGALAAKVSSARGGNLFFIAKDEDVKTVFGDQLDAMVTEVAHDVRIRLMPAPGYRISGVFGVPDGLMTNAGEGEVAITVPTAFLSRNGGGIFVSVAKAGARAHLPATELARGRPLLSAALNYVSAADDRRGSQRVVAGSPSNTPSTALQVAHALVDEYLVLKDATLAFHRDGKPKQAFQLLTGLSSRLSSLSVATLHGERTLVARLLAKAALHSGYGGEAPRTGR
jgi:Ca-activated chloride channel family protein